MKEALLKEQSAQQEVAPLERAQSRSPPPGTGDGSESLSSVTEELVSCCSLRPVGIESASCKAQVPENNVEIAAAFRCSSGHYARRALRSRLDDVSLESLERELAIAEEEYRQMKEALLKEQSAQQEVAPLERAQSRSPPPGTGDGSESLSSVTEELVSCCSLRPVGIESASCKAQVPENNVEIAAAFRCSSGHYARRALRSRLDDVSLESLERELAIAEEEYRQMKEALLKEQSAQQEVAPLERAQSRSPPPGRGDGSEPLSSVTEKLGGCCSLRLVGIESASSEAQVPANNVEITGAVLPDVAQSEIQAEREQQSLPAGLEMTAVDGNANNQTVGKTNPVGGAREGAKDVCAEPHEHEEKGGSPGTGVQCELSLRIDVEAVRLGCFTNDADETSSSAVAAPLEAQVSQLTGGGFETADRGTGSATVERLPYESRSAGRDSVCVISREQSTETRRKFAGHLKSRQDPGVDLPMQLEGLASGVNTLPPLSTQSTKTPSENMGLSIVMASGLSALTANERRKLNRQQRKRNVTARTACAAPIFGRRRQVQVFDPGGRR
ncbi:hypothetical protein V5799_017122 [Amblyomma americanum]|uniref:Uncharacterized protein n=1 Tax=Amblyomma americanum TaxID=6943 RepID=A0AAQ4F354_AMBAM